MIKTHCEAQWLRGYSGLAVALGPRGPGFARGHATILLGSCLL